MQSLYSRDIVLPERHRLGNRLVYQSVTHHTKDKVITISN